MRFYSKRNLEWDTMFSFFLHQILVKFDYQYQFWNLLVVSFSKLSLLLIFGQVKVEKIELEDTRGHFQCGGPEAFLGLIFHVSEAPETKLKVFLGFIGPSP